MQKARGTAKWVPVVAAAAVTAGAMVGGAGVLTPARAQVLTPGKPPAPGPMVVEAPLSLTASDGAGLELVRIDAQVVVEDPVAFTELRLTFRNPEDRVREGRFRIALPQNAAISRFAMNVNGRWQEGEVVELQAAREAYEDFLHRRQDPALLETEAGNEFSARVFPIPPRATKELIVSYSQELTRGGDPYVLPLRGLPTLGQLAIRALVAKADAKASAASSLGGRALRHEIIEVEKRGWKPDRDFEVTVPPAGSRIGLRHENLVVMRVQPLAESLPADSVKGLLVLFDTSASRALGFGEQIARLDGVLATLGRTGDPDVEVVAFDQTVETVFAGKASAWQDGARAKLRARRALGASDLDRALRTLGERKGKLPPRLLLVSDGVATAGATGNAELRERVRALGERGVERLDVLAVGGIRDDERLTRLVSAGLPRAGVIVDARASIAEAAHRLSLATRTGLKVEVDGAAWVWPQTIDGVQAGDEVLVYADLPAAKPLRVRIGGQAVGAGGTLAVVERPLLERAWVKARIARLLAQRDTVAAGDADLAEAMRKQVIDLSTKHRVLSPFTALLVLETEWDYQRFGIARRGLADILSVGPSGVTVVARKDAPAIATDDAERFASAEGAASPPSSGGERRRAAANEPGKGAARPRSAPATAAAAPAPVMQAAPAPEMKMEESAASTGRAANLGGLAGGGAPAASAPRPSREMSKRMSADDPLGGLADRRARAFSPEPPPPPSPPRDRVVARPAEPKKASVAPYEGPFAELMAMLAAGKKAEARDRALAWRERDAGDVLALVALGEAAEALGDVTLAARAYGSLIDLFPGRADMRRFAGNRLDRLRGAEALALAVDTYRKAAEQRPDHPASHRLYAFALIKTGRPDEAFAAIEAGLGRRYPDGRFAGVDRILRDDLGLAAAAWMKASPKEADAIRERLARAGVELAAKPSLRFVLTWETDANDVDFHIYDGRGGHAYYSDKRLASGGELYADVTTGYGPECFTVPGSARAFPYKLQAHYYSRGPMGYGMGKLQVIEHDGRGGMKFDERPFVVMRDGAFVDLGVVKGPPAAVATSTPGTVLAR